MIHLTDKHIAVEIPEDATEVELIGENAYSVLCFTNTEEFGVKNIILKDNWALMIMDIKPTLVGVTPLTEEQIHDIVGSQFTKGTTYCGDFSIPYGYNISPKDRWDDIQRLKRLDPNKKYAIIKIEKE
ncbi:MAG: hypothetical protein KIC84_11570 [Dysgonomonas mossii]|uniref:hypothetical protein n=1 Tax=Dysgonomonas mossii TaxID=163665 RepID=UPI0026EE2152|nr:hypothetical protein [Dysgonomonas mossii]MBS5907853.1 hypothetical protein [Dysgonomonas mossii]